MYDKLFYFNPSCEMAVANGHTSYMPPQKINKFENDLEVLPLWLAAGKDLLLTRNPVDKIFTETLSKLGIAMPRFIQSVPQLNRENISELHPWGWSPAVHKKLEAFKAQCASTWNGNPMCSWNETHKEMLSRLSGLELYEKFEAKLAPEHTLLETPTKPLIVSSPEQLFDIQKSMSFPIVLKTPWSASGRGLFKIDKPGSTAFTNRHISGKLKQQGFLLAEPFLEKIQDVSFHFWSGKQGIRYLGCTFFKTDRAGQFLGCYTHAPILEELKYFPLNESIEQAKQVLQQSLENMKLYTRYHGPVGIDAIFFRNKNNAVKLHPCIEMNLRYTMGLMNIRLTEKLQTKSRGFWQIVNIERTDWDKLANEKGIVSGKDIFKKGVLPLTPPPKQSGFLAYIEF
jgi:hypothetical protein